MISKSPFVKRLPGQNLGLGLLHQTVAAFGGDINPGGLRFCTPCALTIPTNAIHNTNNVIILIFNIIPSY
jgi:hypothetical protein